ncbi:PPOX class F420-dependent oxidoreductase [Rathayibacter iranicus]|uniref:PPOX class F420-dependent oxidoreductase n=2 Tax=Rathayibacter iranicus TaxID=59737 RepID=A0AAD1AD96_9MICO|nr:PPOX class F420-dependent oxidoreductase [Rathayibacter iranicus]AZZ56286.1 PPOX class F420-dependent oxidoreductase [Rathayibacter iranicus]MWV29998.1 PPOX class F420-dependent oxidoreductase [Rathayibacter iranicus NCPPB 2253 = VKM Ac-1602]PPI45898.1 PPOX class F420-dependent oxidoreductase [Rathayibacter iranicus]PPI59727.1 PPOX class F420-dependent oxidoreductase [Rathayibacter iranicus]PPI70736.1 PPOX class F420-dependent oxidoreductase [Rathayibacter iranicus]
MPLSPALAALSDASFVSLTTFRKNGVGVSTPVWIARDGDELIVTTPRHSGKVKRLRNDPRVTLVPCDRRGRVADRAAVLEADATIDADTAEVERLGLVFLSKYRLEYRVFMLIERLVSRGDRTRVMLRVTDR